jgi:hypothetical protein
VRVIERGDIFFFYRPRVETEQVEGREDVQRFFMLLAPDRRRGPLFRLFVVGRKQLPEVRPGEAHPEERNWALNVLTTSAPDELRRELAAKEYSTTTRGQRLVGAAKPVGEGRYQLVMHGGHSELAYVLEVPKEPGPAQQEFEIKRAASYVVAVKNPEVVVPGFPSSEDGPRYPDRLRQKFGDRRWIEVDDPELLNHRNTQVVLLGARAEGVEEELGIDVDEEEETEHSAEIFRKLRLRRGQVPVRELFRGVFPEHEMPAAGDDVETLPPEKAPGRAGRTGGRAAARRGSVGGRRKGRW